MVKFCEAADRGRAGFQRRLLGERNTWTQHRDPLNPIELRVPLHRQPDPTRLPKLRRSPPTQAVTGPAAIQPELEALRWMYGDDTLTTADVEEARQIPAFRLFRNAFSRVAELRRDIFCGARGSIFVELWDGLEQRRHAVPPPVLRVAETLAGEMDEVERFFTAADGNGHVYGRVVNA